MYCKDKNAQDLADRIKADVDDIQSTRKADRIMGYSLSNIGNSFTGKNTNSIVSLEEIWADDARNREVSKWDITKVHVAPYEEKKAIKLDVNKILEDKQEHAKPASDEISWTFDDISSFIGTVVFTVIYAAAVIYYVIQAL